MLADRTVRRHRGQPWQNPYLWSYWRPGLIFRPWRSSDTVTNLKPLPASPDRILGTALIEVGWMSCISTTAPRRTPARTRLATSSASRSFQSSESTCQRICGRWKDLATAATLRLVNL